jgi:hypothetical protein
MIRREESYKCVDYIDILSDIAKQPGTSLQFGISTNNLVAK